jgi:Protein of unknown function (DUF4065)
MANVKKITDTDINPTYEMDHGNGDARLAELILYIAEKCEDEPHFGATVLNKILWCADTMSYAYYGEAVTGVAYQRLPRGPAPKRLLPVKNKLLAEGQIIERRRRFGSFLQHRIVPTRDANLDAFSGRDIATVDQAIQFMCGKSATKVSNWSHMRAWHVAGPNGLIPYEAIFLSDEDPTEYDILRTQELDTQLGWGAAEPLAAAG